MSMHYGTGPNIFKNAQELRERETDAEKILWQSLSKKRLGVKFRRQHPKKKFIVDFYCHGASLIIELDGGIHDAKSQK
jgi:imidazole glycerol-phosphate synthase subunit HisF